MKKMELKEATGPLREYARGRHFEPLVLTAKGKPVAALIHIEEAADWETMSLGMNPEFMAIIESSRARAKKEGSIPIAEARERLWVPAKRRGAKLR